MIQNLINAESQRWHWFLRVYHYKYSKGFCCKCYWGQAEYRVGKSRMDNIFHCLIWIQNHTTKSCQWISSNLLCWLADMSSNSTLISLCAVQPFNNYLAAGWNVNICFYVSIEYLVSISKRLHYSCYLYATKGPFRKTIICLLLF